MNGTGADVAEWRLYEITSQGDKWPDESVTFFNKRAPWPKPEERGSRKTLLDLPHLLILEFPDGWLQVFVHMESPAAS